MVALGMNSSVAFLSFLYITCVMSASWRPTPAPEPNSLVSSPNPEANSPEPSPATLADSPETQLPPTAEGLFDVTDYGAEPDGETETSSVCFLVVTLIL